VPTSLLNFAIWDPQLTAVESIEDKVQCRGNALGTAGRPRDRSSAQLQRPITQHIAWHVHRRKFYDFEPPPRLSSFLRSGIFKAVWNPMKARPRLFDHAFCLCHSESTVTISRRITWPVVNHSLNTNPCIDELHFRATCTYIHIPRAIGCSCGGTCTHTGAHGWRAPLDLRTILCDPHFQPCGEC